MLLEKTLATLASIVARHVPLAMAGLVLVVGAAFWLREVVQRTTKGRNMTMRYKGPLVLVMLLAVVLAGCDPTTGMPGQKATVGGLGGAAAGGLLGAAAGGSGGRDRCRRHSRWADRRRHW